MCGRFMFQPQAQAELRRIYELATRQGFTVQTGLVRPNDSCAVVWQEAQQIKVGAMKWGLLSGPKDQLVINARSETVAQKPLFAAAFARRRLVYPTSGFFEFNSQHEAVWFNYQTQPTALYIAGIYETFAGERRSSLLTTQPNVSVAAVHNRMPLILRKDQIIKWLQDQNWARNFLQASMPTLTAVPAKPTLW
ncbi:SOS response-associated peptidase family protein [Lactobacillus sp. DCY120]|uniref:Abasic site processing protein n=2 Tax=Bombilactobacillus apium TaxID=2675299 RepID=A0A850R8T4_9LACO|nr:SOS response-associated peptidase family protein [Bombilactobacillus apium]